MRRLFPRPTDAAPAPDEAPGDIPAKDYLALADRYPYPESVRTGEPWVRVNMVGTLDGAAHVDGLSSPVSSAADMRVLGVLRALSDVIVAGAATVRGEGYRPGRARAVFAERRAAEGQAPAPAIAVVSGRLDLDFDAPLFTAAPVPTLLLTGTAAPDAAKRAAERAGAVVLTVSDGPRVEPAAAVAALAERGLTRQLLEGGPRVLGQFIAEDAVDEMCLTVSPNLTAGAAERIAHGPSVPAPRRMRLAGVLEEDGFLFTRYLRERGGS